jgi:hypothetical protein
MWIVDLETLLREKRGFEDEVSMDQDGWSSVVRAACPAHGAVVIGRVITSSLPLRCVNELACAVAHFEGGAGIDDVVDGVARALEDSPASPLELAAVVERLRGLVALPSSQLDLWPFAVARGSRRVLAIAVAFSSRCDDDGAADQAFLLLMDCAPSLSLGVELVPLLRDLVVGYFAAMDISVAPASGGPVTVSRHWSTLRRLRLALSSVVKAHGPAAALFASDLLLDAIHSPACAVGRVLGYGSIPPLSADSSQAPTNMPSSLQLAPPFGDAGFPADVEVASNRAHLFSLVTTLVRNCPDFPQALRRCLLERAISKVALAHQLQAAQSSSSVPTPVATNNPTASNTLSALHKAYQLPRRPAGELDTIIFRAFSHNPAMWELLLPLAERPAEFAECRPVLLILLAHLVASWHTEVSEGSERLMSETSRLLLALYTAGFLPPPLDRVSRMLPAATRAETAKLLMVCWEYLADSAMEVGGGGAVSQNSSVEPFSKRVRLIVEANIESLGPFFADFVL